MIILLNFRFHLIFSRFMFKRSIDFAGNCEFTVMSTVKSLVDSFTPGLAAKFKLNLTSLEMILIIEIALIVWNDTSLHVSRA